MWLESPFDWLWGNYLALKISLAGYLFSSYLEHPLDRCFISAMLTSSCLLFIFWMWLHSETQTFVHLPTGNVWKRAYWTSVWENTPRGRRVAGMQEGELASQLLLGQLYTVKLAILIGANTQTHSSRGWVDTIRTNALNNLRLIKVRKSQILCPVI